MSKAVPEVRFQGFGEGWESNKLNNLAEFSKGSGYKKNDLVKLGAPIILYGRLYTRYETVINNVDTFVNTANNSVVSEGNEVIVPSSGESAEDIARASFVKMPGIILGGDLNIIKPGAAVSPIFLALTISNGKQKKELAKKAQGKSIVHLNNSDLKEVILKYPPIKEQQRIGTFFKQLDDTIALQQQLVEQQQQYKKAMLQKMFPQKEEHVPKVRFDGFDDVWKKHNVSDFSVDTFGGGTPRTTNDEFWGGTIPWIQSSDLQEHKVSNVATKKGITEIALKKSATKLVPKNSIAIVTRVGVGKLALMPFEYTTSQDFLSLSNLKVNEWFGVYSIYNKLQRELQSVQGTSIKGITKAALLEKDINIPLNLGEQQKIGMFFKQLDDTITLHKKKLEDYHQLKKALLQRMFV